MPGRDGIGSMGMGEMTGRSAGYCAEFGAQGRENTAPRRGLGMGFLGGRGSRDHGFGGNGRGRRDRFFATGLPGWMRLRGCAAPNPYQTTEQKPSPEMETHVLQNQAEILRQQLDFIKERLTKIKTEPAKDFS
jgi:hypothetical protein